MTQPPTAPASPNNKIAAPRAGQFRSRVVRTLRIVLPLLALAIVATALLWPREQAPIEIKVEKIDIEGDRIAMQQSSYRGTTDEGEPFTVSADKISQSLKQPNLFEMEQIKASIGSDEQGAIMMSAPKGQYDQQSRKLLLMGVIAISSDKGYRIEAGDTHIDLGLNQARSDQPVQATGPMGEIRAGNMTVTERGNRLEFGDGVHLIYRVAANE